MADELKPLLEENERAGWEKVTRKLASWARQHLRHVSHPDRDEPYVTCLTCQGTKELGEDVFVTYSEVRGKTHKNLFCSILCQRQSKVAHVANRINKKAKAHA